MEAFLFSMKEEKVNSDNPKFHITLPVFEFLVEFAI